MTSSFLFYELFDVNGKNKWKIGQIDVTKWSYSYYNTQHPVSVHYDMIWYDIFKCNWVVTRWQMYSIHLHTNSTQNDTKQTIHRTTQQFNWRCVIP